MKIFDKWETTGIGIVDPGIKNYVNLSPIIVPRTGGRDTKVRFHRNKKSIVERLINKVMIPGHKGKKHKYSSGRCSGKSVIAYKIVKKTFMIIEKKLDKNPVEVLVKAIENAAPREEITTIEYGGARYPQAVDCSPQRRVDIALRMITQGAYASCFGKKLKAEDALANEIIKAYNNEQTSVAISKKLELERQADSSR